MLQAPARLIANNAGVEGDVIVEKVFGQPWEQGYNAMDDKIENLLEAGIIDPAKVTSDAFLDPSLLFCQLCMPGSTNDISQPVCCYLQSVLLSRSRCLHASYAQCCTISLKAL